MDCIEALVTRRSIRRFEDAPVPAEQIETVLRAAMAAPSAFNERSARFVVVNDRSVLALLAETHQYSRMLAEAPVGIVVCGDRTSERYSGFYWVQDCSAAITNLLNAAHSIGLGACWVGVQPWPDRAKHVRETLGLPNHIEPHAMVALGRPAEEKNPVDRFDPSLIRYDSWNSSPPER